MGKNSLKKILFVTLVIIWGIVIFQSIALAQTTFPTRPVTIWVTYAAGGITDTVLRTIADASEKSLGQKMVIINKTGGGGVVAVSLLTHEKPDGYTLVGCVDAPITRVPHIRDLDYDPFLNLTHIIRVCLFKSVFVVKSDSPFKQWGDVVDWAKKNPGQLLYGETGPGTVPYLAMAKVARKEGFTYKGVTFPGDGPMLNALLGGHVMITNLSSVACKGQVAAKTVRALLVHEREGLSYAPEAPTFEKMHYDFELPNTIIISAPEGLPDPVRERLEKAFIEGINSRKFMKVAEDNELIMREPLTGKALNDYLRKTYLSYETFIKEAGIYKIDKK